MYQKNEKILPTLKEKIVKSWFNNGLIIIVNEISQAIKLINTIAPEHLELCVDNPKFYLKDIKNAKNIFRTLFPEAIGDYIAGPNHVLPTSGTAKFSSGLGTIDFLTRTTFVHNKNLNTLGKQASFLADAEVSAGAQNLLKLDINKNLINYLNLQLNLIDITFLWQKKAL